MARRRGYLDWLRGIAVLIMIEAHVLDSWTADEFRSGAAFAIAMIVGGFGAPLFLFLAGVAVALSATAKFQRTGDRAAAASAVVRRGGELFGLAFLFRIQAWALGWSSPTALLKVDILNIMGPSIAAAGGLWGILRTRRAQLLAFSLATVTLAFLTPLLRTAPIHSLPDPVEAYIRPVPYLSHFVLFPWGLFVVAGVIPGLLLATDFRESRTNVWLVVAGLSTSGAAALAASLPLQYLSRDFWTTSPCYFFVRVGLMTAAIGAAFGWASRTGGTEKWSPLQQLGRSSLFVYWIHVELVYGLISRPLHHSLTLTQAVMSLTLFSGLMLLCTVGKDRLLRAWSQSSERRQPAGRPPCESVAQAIYNRPS
jgi:uncharacterized membrane protein